MERRRVRQREIVMRRRRNSLIALAAVALVAGVIAGAGGDERSDTGSVAAKAKPPPTLPGGGRKIIPGRHVVALYGAPQDPELGALGIGSPGVAASRLRRQTRAYRAGRRTRELPAMELIAAVANRDAGDDGKYRTRQTDAVIGRYLKAARKIDAILLLDIQPGRADFLTEAKALRKWLAEPDVSLALDPEWRMQEGQVPGQTIGSVSAQEVNSVARWLSDLGRSRRLPQKLLVIHQFTKDMVRGRETLERPPGVMPVLNVDGFGTREQKEAKYRELAQRRLPNGFKLFYKEDRGLMPPRAVEALRPQPQLVVYE